MTTTADDIDRLLPQTQCRECGYKGCLPYAVAILQGEAHNLCAPGGEAVIRDISALLGKPVAEPSKKQPKALAWIDESACIGCTACIRACPTDAIMGASKFMHTVIADECTGCGLCIAPCPVDCIHMQPVSDTFLPRARHFSLSADSRFAAAEHARTRYLRHNERKRRETAERKAMLAEREAAGKPPTHREKQHLTLPTSSPKPWQRHKTSKTGSLPPTTGKTIRPNKLPKHANVPNCAGRNAI